MKITKDVKKGKEYYRLREDDGKTLKSFGTNKPIRYIPILLQGDVMEMLQHVPDNSIDLVVADPPYNIGVKYGTSFNDTKPFMDYIEWCRQWLTLSFTKLKDGGSLFLINYPEASAYLKVLVLDKLFNYRKTITWCYESMIGLSPKNFTTASRQILYYTKGNNFTFNKEDIVIPYVNLNDKRIQERMKMGSKGKAPYDYWFFNLVKNVSKDKIDNTCGNSGPSNQIPKKLIERIIKVSTNRGDTVLSLFAGTGTDLEVCCKLDVCRRCIGIELNPDFCNGIKTRLFETLNKKIKNLDTVKSDGDVLGFLEKWNFLKE